MVALPPKNPGRNRSARLASLHQLVIRPRTTFRGHPIDDLIGVLDIAGFAMHAVGGIDLQPLAALFLDHFIDIGRAEAGAGIVILFGALRHTDVGIRDVQVHGLFFIVLGRSEIHGG